VAQQEIATVIAEVWKKFQDTIMGRVAVVELAAHALLKGTLDGELRQKAERDAHKLAGSLGTFGFPQGSHLAREIEEILKVEVIDDHAQTEHLIELVAALRRELEQPQNQLWTPASLANSPPLENRTPLLLIVDDDHALAEQLAQEAAARGLRTAVASSVAFARAMFSRLAPDIVLLDLAVPGGIPEGTLESFALLSEVTIWSPSVPVLILTARDTLVDRVEAARRGAHSFLQKPLSPVQVIDVVLECLRGGHVADRTVLAVDDDPQVLEVLRCVLDPHKITLISLSDPAQFWHILETVEPNLLVLDVDMPKMNGLELCRALRNDKRWADLPVIFLTAHTETKTVQAVFAAGADDFVGKPIIGPELVARITSRLERSHLLRSMAEIDSLTGVVNRRKSLDILGRFVRLVLRHGQPLTLAVVDLDDFKGVNDRYGHGAGDEVLRHFGELLRGSFRSEDVVARWGGEEFIVGMYGTARQHGVTRLESILERFRQEEFTAPDNDRFRVTFSAGVAECPADGADLPALYRAADLALYQAKATGRNRILAAV
jgi:diguanylate cyclase (GGDEF)-like protein